MDLRDKLKFWIMLSNYVDMIVRGTSPLSLPDAIADSLSYVKAFGGTEQRNLPDDYIERQFIYMMDGSYLLTDIVPTYDCKVEMDFQTTTMPANAGSFMGGRSGSFPSGLTFGFNADKNFVFDGFSGNRYISTNLLANNTRYKYTWDNQVAKLETGGSVVGTNTFTGTGTTTHPLAINGLNNAGSVFGNIAGIYLYSFKAWNAQGELVMNLVPAVQKGTVSVVGFYDTVSKTFKTATAGTFAAGGEAVPTPDTPMDIVSNNGVLKVRHQSGLPLGYTLLEYIESSGTQYIDTGVYISTGYKVRVKAYATSIHTTIAFFGCTSTASSSDANKGIYRIFGSSINRCAWGNGGGSVVGNLTGNDSINTWYDMVCDNGVWTINDTLFATCLEVSFTSEYSMWLFVRNTGGTVGLPASCRISVCQIWDNNGQMIRNLVPVKNSSNVLGMYDLVSGQFFTNQGTGDFTAGTAVSDPVEIYTDGTVETINVHGKNLFDSTPYKTGYYIDASGNEVEATQYQEEYLIRQARVQPSTQYTISLKGVFGSYTQRIHAYDAAGNWLSQVAVISNITAGVVSSASFTTPANCAYIRQGGRSQTEYQLELGSTATPYVPYYNGGTATAEMLLKAGTYQDVQSIIDGVVTRSVGVKVLDGTESWIKAPGYTNIFYTDSVTDAYYGDTSSERIAIPCTHLQGTDATNINMQDNQIKLTAQGSALSTPLIYVKSSISNNDLTTWQNWLATQYANGTPVIIAYPLKNATTESVTGQTLQVQEGNNILEITQASMDGLELEASYKKGA